MELLSGCRHRVSSGVQACCWTFCRLPAALGTRMDQTDLDPAAGGREDRSQRGGRVWTWLPKLKRPAAVWRSHQERDEQDPKPRSPVQPKDPDPVEEQLVEVCRTLILREERLYAQDGPRSQAEEELLQGDLQDFTQQVWLAVGDTFTLSSAHQQGRLRSAVASIQLQEEQDRRWAERPEGRGPAWRPLNCLSEHDAQLDRMVRSRLAEAGEDQAVGRELSSDIKRQVCRAGRRVKEDLLTVASRVAPCYPASTDILGVYAGLYHRAFSARLTDLLQRQPDAHDCYYLLLWVNHCYHHEVLSHAALQGKLQAASGGALLQQQQLEQLEQQYVSSTEDRVQQCLNRALCKEQHGWQSGSAPPLSEEYCYSHLASDVIELLEHSLGEFRLVVRELSQWQLVTRHLEDFLCRYTSCFKEVLSLNLSNKPWVIKAQLVCEEQLRAYVSGAQHLSEERRRRCLEQLTLLRDCGYRCLTLPVHVQLEGHFRKLWTPGWEDGSLPVVDTLLNFLFQHLADLKDLKPSCRQAVLGVLHEDVVLHYVTKTLSSRKKSREQEVGGAQRVTQDAQLMDEFFTEGLAGPSWLCSLLCGLAEVLRLQDPDSITLEICSLSRTFPDFSGVHLLALLALKSSLSARDVCTIKQSVKRTRPLHEVSNSSCPFFSKVKISKMKTKLTHANMKLLRTFKR